MKRIEISSEQRRLVERLAGFGLSHADIAYASGIALRTLQRRFAVELANGAPKVNGAVLNSLYKLALDGNVAACIFWAKCRCGWREVVRTELSGPDGAPLTTEVPSLTIIQETVTRPSVMTDGDLAACVAEHERRQTRQ